MKALKLGLAFSLAAILILPGLSCGKANGFPVISSLQVKDKPVAIQATTEIKCFAADPDGDSLTYIWSASGGSISGQGSVVSWKAPANPGAYTVSVNVADGKGGEAVRSLSVNVTKPPPVITGLIAEPAMLDMEKESSIKCLASSPSGSLLSYVWSAEGGTFQGQGSSIAWKAPKKPGAYNIEVTVQDTDGGSAKQRLTVKVLENHAPVIRSVTADPAIVIQSKTAGITCVASDPDGDTLTYSWSCPEGSFSGEGSAVTWSAPSKCAFHTITVKVSDGRGGEAAKELRIRVKAEGG